MTKEQAIKRKAELEAELKQVEEILQQPKISREERFLGLINGLQLKFDFEKYRDRLFFFRGDEVWLEYDLKYKYLWVSHEKWEVFENEYSMDYDEIQTFIKNMVGRHFNLKGVTPQRLTADFNTLVERHFNLKGVTPPRITTDTSSRWSGISNS
jgi:hypothetical protein